MFIRKNKKGYWEAWEKVRDIVIRTGIGVLQNGYSTSGEVAKTIPFSQIRTNGLATSITLFRCKYEEASTGLEKRTANHWLAGETTVELANKSHLARSVVTEVIKDVGNARLVTADIKEQPPVYNVWNMSACDPRFGQKHPGQIPGQAIINLLLWLTNPFDVESIR